VTNKIYVANAFGTVVTVIEGATKSTAAVTVGSGHSGVTVNPVTNKIYLANTGSNDVTVIDGANNGTTTVTGPHVVAPFAVAVNSLTNKI
jgi:YVTN family beta-propeller protein